MSGWKDQISEYTVHQATRVLGVTPARVYKWAEVGLMPKSVRGGTMMLTRADIVRLRLLLLMQSLLGQHSPFCHEVVKQIPDDVARALTVADVGQDDPRGIRVTVNGADVVVTISAPVLRDLARKMAEVEQMA